MKKSIVICLLLGMLLGINGCAKRIEITTIEKERVDQNLSEGNKGYITGTPPPVEESKERQVKREIYQVTVDLPPYPEWKKYHNEDKELWGNRGYVYGGPKIKQLPQQPAQETPAPIVLPEEKTELEETSQPEMVLPYRTKSETKTAVSYTTYTVQKGDSLGKISKIVYGTADKWKIIYDANKDTLKNPNKIYPGQKLKIPQK